MSETNVRWIIWCAMLAVLCLMVGCLSVNSRRKAIAVACVENGGSFVIDRSPSTNRMDVWVCRQGTQP